MMMLINEDENNDSADEQYKKTFDDICSLLKNDKLPKTALIDAIRFNSMDGVKANALINAGVDVNITDDLNKTALFYAAYNGNTANAAQALIAAGADVNIIDKDGETALFFAVTNRNVHVVCTLIDAGADVNVINKKGETALFYAGTNELGEIARVLIDAGADVSIIDNDGKTALFFAVTNRNEHVVRSLIDAGADVNVIDKKGETPFFYAINSRNENTVRALVEAGADVNVPVSVEQGKIPLIYAIVNNRESVISPLIEAADADLMINGTDNEGKTALIYAVLKRKDSLVNVLLEAGADVNVSDNSKTTALQYAASKENYSAVCALIDNGNAPVNARDVYGRTPLFYAITDAWSLSSACAILDRGGDMYAKDNFNVSFLEFFIDDCLRRGLEYYSFDFLTHMTKGLDAFKERGLNSETIFEAVVNVVFCKILNRSFIKTSRRNETAETIYFKTLEKARVYIAEDSLKKDILNDLLIILNEKNTCDSLIPKILASLIDLGANPNTVDSDGNTALHYATRLPFYGLSQETVMEILHLLQSKGMNFNAKNIRNETPLLFCLCERFHAMEIVKQQLLNDQLLMEVIRILLKNGSSVKEITHRGESFLLLTFKAFSKSKTKQRIPVNKINEMVNGEIPKELNQMLVMMKIVQMIAREDGINGMTFNQRDAQLNSPLHLWASLELTSIHEYTDVEDNLTFAEMSKTIFEVLVGCGAKLNDRNAKEETPLHLCRTWTAVKLLIDAGANPKDVDSLGRSPLIAAAKNKTILKNADCFYSDFSQDPKDLWRSTLQKELDPWTIDKNGESVLSVLIESEKFVLANALVEVARDDNYLQSDMVVASLLNAVCKDKSSRAHWKSNLVEIILKENPMTRGIGKDLPLHLCCRNIILHANPPTVRIKRKRREKINNEESEESDESVHWTIAKLLLRYGADCTIPDDTGQSCLDIAETCLKLKDLLLKPVDIDEIPVLIPWTSVSKRYEQKLARVARRQECENVDSFWYHKEHLGCGSFGFVFAGINGKDGRKVAIKRIETLRMDRREDMREIANLKDLADCEQIIRYFSFFEDDISHFSYIVLELMEGNLEEYLDATFEPQNIVSLCKDVVIGLNFLHDLYILHRDLKPTNILFKTHPKLCLKIADFGLSRRIDSTSTTVYGTNAGTRCWIAPEVLKGLEDHSTSSDIFACGLLIHYILSNKRHPFASDDCAKKSLLQINTETEVNVMNDDMKGWDYSLNPEATHLVKLMLDSHKSKRPSTFVSIAHPFFWSNKKKIDLLVAVGNQPEFECPRAHRSNSLSAVERDLETSFGITAKHTKWNDPGYAHMPTIDAEMTKWRRYDAHSIVELVRFIRNAYAHVSAERRPAQFKKHLLEDYVFLEYFPNLVIEVFKAVTTHRWDQTREEVKNATHDE